jgi:hypothetical protein
VIPNTVEILGSSCFRECKSLSSILFESHSQLKRIESLSFCGCHLSIMIPSTAVFVAYDAHPKLRVRFIIGGLMGCWRL